MGRPVGALAVRAAVQHAPRGALAATARARPQPPSAGSPALQAARRAQARPRCVALDYGRRCQRLERRRTRTRLSPCLDLPRQRLDRHRTQQQRRSGERAAREFACSCGAVSKQTGECGHDRGRIEG